MSAVRYDIEIEQGVTFIRKLQWKDEAGDIVDLTGYTARAVIRETYDSSAILTMTTENGRITLGEVTEGSYTYNILIEIDSADTAALTDWGKGVWDLKLISSGPETRLVHGKAILSQEVSYV